MPLLRRIANLLRRSRLDQEIEAELRSHIEMRAADNVAAGMSPQAARRDALLRFGNPAAWKEDVTAADAPLFLESLWQDLGYGLRQLRRNPGFTVVAVLTLALGIGANTAVFSMVEAVLLRAFPYPDPGQLVLVFRAPEKQPDALSALSYRDFRECQTQNRVFSAMAGNAFHDLTLTGAGEPSVVNTADVTPELFPLLGARPLAGRTLLPSDGEPGAAPVAVVSENLWRGRFGADPGLIGRSISLDRRLFTVVGILPASFRYPDGAARQDVWIAIAQDPLFGPLLWRAGVPAMGGIARLRPGISLVQARAEMHAIAARLARQYPAQDAGLTIRLVPYRQAVVGNVKPALLILLGAVALVLLIACANIANLLLSRAASRDREIAMRIALGAGRARIVRQWLTESALLGVFGAIAGVLLAAASLGLLRPWLPSALTRIQSVRIGAPVLVFALALSWIAAMVFGAAPALLATPANWLATLKQGAERGGRRGKQRVRNGLAVAEISLAVVLLIAGGLLLRGLARVTAANPGFDPNQVTEAEISLPRFQYATPRQWAAFADALLARLHAMPGLQDSALGAPLPMDRQGEAAFPFTIVGDPPLPPGKTLVADYATVSPGYFRVLRIPLLRGRFFAERDSPAAMKVAIISQRLARRFFPNRNPLGRQMKFGFPPDTQVARTIVGVVGDVRDESLGKEPAPMMYVPFAQAPLWGGEVVVRSSLSMASVAAGIRQATHALDKDLPVTGIASFPEVIGGSIAQDRFRALLLGSFAGLALVLAAIGIFGVMAYSTAQRTREIGVRMALGAHPRDVRRLVLVQGAKLALLGLGAGILAALLLTRLMTSMLHGVSAADPVTFAAVAALLLAVALLACYIPARRAMRVDPMVALRHE